MDWLTNAWTTLSEALGVRRYIVLFSAGGAAAALAAAYSYLRAIPAMSWLPDAPVWAVFSVVLFGWLLYLVINYATQLRKEAEPRLKFFEGELRREDGFPLGKLRHRIGFLNTGQSTLEQLQVALSIRSTNGMQTFGDGLLFLCAPHSLRPGEPDRATLVTVDLKTADNPTSIEPADAHLHYYMEINGIWQRLHTPYKLTEDEYDVTLHAFCSNAPRTSIHGTLRRSDRKIWVLDVARPTPTNLQWWQRNQVTTDGAR